MKNKKFIFITSDGYTQAPNNEEIENCQVLGVEEGADEKEALGRLYKNNTWIKTTGFDDVICYELKNGGRSF